MKRSWWVVFEDQLSGLLYLSEQPTRCLKLEHYVYAHRSKKAAASFAVKALKVRLHARVARTQANIRGIQREARA